MYLTTDNAGQYVGKTLDSSTRFLHHYPLRVIQHSNGSYYFVDRLNTMMEVPSEKDTFTVVHFDMVNGEAIDHGTE